VLTYEQKLHSKKIGVVLKGSMKVSDHLLTDLATYGACYGFTFLSDDLEELPLSNSFDHSHLIWMARWSEWSEILTKIRSILDMYSSVSLVLEYETDAEFLSSNELVGNSKRQFGDRLNFLMPVRRKDGRWVVPHQKILDNAVCDTVRVKYIPLQRTSTMPCLTSNELTYFAEVCQIYSQHMLYFRAPTDGYIAFRHGDESGFLITATKTNKLTLDLNRISLVHSYNQNQNILEYSGRYLPSSDSVEAAIVFQEHPTITSIIHTHASHLFTRNPKYAQRILVPPLPYGSPLLGDAISKAISINLLDWLIMEDHGELFFGTSGHSAIATLRDACNAEISSRMGERNG
jgi:hypothetical protein